MSLSLSVTIENICLFVLWDEGAESWIVHDELHRPELHVRSNMTLPKKYQGQKSIDLTGYNVSFGIGDPDNGGRELPMSFSRLEGRTDCYIDIRRIVPDVVLLPDWIPGDKRMPGDMVTRIALPGGQLIALEQQTPGGMKSWRIGDNIVQQLTSESTFVRAVDDVPFVRLSKPDGSSQLDIRIEPNAKGICALSLGAQDVTGQSTLELKYGEVFVKEVEALQKPFDLPEASFPFPHTYWPEYKKCADKQLKENDETRRAGFDMTDPCGGPCPTGLFDLRTLPLAVVVMRSR